MATYYNIQSQVTTAGGIPLVIDIEEGSHDPNKPVKDGTWLDAFTPTGNDNQWWELVLDTASGYHFIQSKLTDLDGDPLVIDIHGGNEPVKPNVSLDVYKKKSSDYDNQLWQFVEQSGQPGWYTIQSKMADENGNTLVIDIRGASDKPGTRLDAFTLNGNPNQLWQLAG
ncbi:MAG TPA: RICIN domain-containing protein [Stellaceae bacterium]|jgi:hypothetical protein|nr:RICIN domain-containing protein [Stellaceae bacterium]